MIWLLLLLIPSLVSAKVAGPLYTHGEREQKEFEHLYKEVNAPPAISQGAGAPSSTPSRIGDIYISSTTGKVYISTSAASSSGWVILN